MDTDQLRDDLTASSTSVSIPEMTGSGCMDSPPSVDNAPRFGVNEGSATQSVFSMSVDSFNSLTRSEMDGIRLFIEPPFRTRPESQGKPRVPFRNVPIARQLYRRVDSNEPSPALVRPSISLLVLQSADVPRLQELTLPTPSAIENNNASAKGEEREEIDFTNNRIATSTSVLPFSSSAATQVFTVSFIDGKRMQFSGNSNRSPSGDRRRKHEPSFTNMSQGDDILVSNGREEDEEEFDESQIPLFSSSIPSSPVQSMGSDPMENKRAYTPESSNTVQSRMDSSERQLSHERLKSLQKMSNHHGSASIRPPMETCLENIMEDDAFTRRTRSPRSLPVADDPSRDSHDQPKENRPRPMQRAKSSDKGSSKRERVREATPTICRSRDNDSEVKREKRVRRAFSQADDRLPPVSLPRRKQSEQILRAPLSSIVESGHPALGSSP